MRSFSPFSTTPKYLVFSITFFVACFFPFAFASAQLTAVGAAAAAARTNAAIPQAPATRTEALVAPQLAVPIPGVNLTAPKDEDGIVTVPFLAQYISGIYRYLLGISTLVAIIMVIYGGFLYLLGATQGKAGEGLGYIKDALGGLVVLYSSYVILWVVNPNLINLQPIRLQSVSSISIEEEQTTLPTFTSDEGPPIHRSSSASGPTYDHCPIPDLPPGHLECGHPVPDQPECSPQHCTALGMAPGCIDSAPAHDPRAVAFEQRISTYVRSTDPRQKALEIASAMSECGVSFGSCRDTVIAVRRMAGVVPLQQTKIHLTDVVRSALTIQRSIPRVERRIAPEGRVAAVAQVRTLVRSERQNEMVNMLQPGDWVWIYNGNDSSSGMHSAMFIRWNDSGTARMLNGTWGRNAWESNFCLQTTGCRNGNFSPITWIK
ncbi:hypothetical protein KBB27_00525 [Patescibacteria group bacterium]|nr:hypothetical protein [Patescibacteria group bacterium]